jgi:hypothetical protein
MKIVALLCGLLALPAAAELPAFRYARSIERPASVQDEILAVTLDSPVYAASRDGFPDLRVLNEGGGETPFLVEKIRESRSESVRLPYAAEVVSLRNLDGNRMEILLRLGKDAPAAEGLRVFTPLKNFENRVQVFGSPDGKDGRPLTEAVIYDYSRHMDVDNRDIPLPPNAFRQFRLVFDEATAAREAEFLDLTRRQREGREVEREEQTRIQRQPLRIDRIEQWSTVVRELTAVDRDFDYTPVSFEVSRDAESQTTRVTVATRREPLTALTLHTASRNFSRPATVQVPLRQGVETRWRDVGAATLQSVHFRAIDRDRLTIPFPEQRQDTYRIIIRDQDNPSLEITGVQARGVGYRLLFLAAPERSFRLVYGAERAGRPDYETPAVLESLRSGYPPVEARLGPETVAADAPAAGTDWRQVLNSKLFLGAVIGLMVVVLAWALTAAGRRVASGFPDRE